MAADKENENTSYELMERGVGRLFDSLFQPICINGMMLKNRIVAAPTGDIFEEKALGGAALVIAGHAIVEPGRSSFASGDEPWPFEKYQREATHERVMAIHRGGARASIEIFHGGLHARVRDYAKGPCSYVRDDGVEVRGMDEPMMEETLDWYTRTCQGAVKSGFDAIFLHFGHGWLPAQFLSPLYNHRTDEYGGSLENRMRFPLRILDTVRKAVGPRFPVDMRISASEWVEGGIEFEDVLGFVREAQRYVDAIQVSSGIDINKFANVHTVSTNLELETPNLGWAREVKKAVDVPVGVVGGVLTPEVADRIIARGDVDLVALGRPLTADPYWPAKAAAGHAEDIAPCLRCSNCYHIATDHWNVGCSVNPRYHHESFVPKDPGKAPVSKRVLVVGAGPGGLKAAITAADRGHRVTLVERNGELGGMLRYIALEPHKVEVARLLDHLRVQVSKRDIDVRLGTTATRELVQDLAPDALCLALGATERRPPVKGIDNPRVMTGTEAIERHDGLSGRIVVLGGGSVGCEVALGLAESGCEVTVVEMQNSLATNANSLYREALRQKFALHDNLRALVGCACQEVGDDTVTCATSDGRQVELPYDHMVVSTGLAPRANEAQDLYGIVRNTVSIGDCVRPSSIMNAIFEGHSFGLSA